MSWRAALHSCLGETGTHHTPAGTPRRGGESEWMPSPTGCCGNLPPNPFQPRECESPPPGCLSSGLRRRWREARALGRLGALRTSPLSMRGWTPEFLETEIPTLRQRPKGRGQPKSDCMIARGRRIIEGSRDTHHRELKNLTSRCGQRGSQNERQSDE